MKKIFWILFGALFMQTACDLQPKVLSFPDSVGDFISARYPALLADPNANPEIYNSAAMDYGVYASPELYGSATNDEYVMYASVNDYILPPQMTDVDVDDNADVAESDNAENKNVDEPSVATVDDYILVPMYGDTGAQRVEYKKDSDDLLLVNKPYVGAQSTTRVELTDVVVARGDTLYSLSRKYSVPVNDLAVMNNLSAPFDLRVGQKIRVPNLARVPVETIDAPVVKDVKKSQKTSVQTNNEKEKNVAQKKVDVQKKVEAPKKVSAEKPVKKISSDPSTRLPKINARSSSKFSWPVRGKILSNYGAKSNGLFNDGINISAKIGAPVKVAENGVVAYAGNEVKGMGNLVIVQHDAGWMTVYAHMGTMTVRRGTRVAVGQKIGTVGKTGKVDVPQLHFEIRKGTKAYNPTQYLKK
ncbi:MAG: M23 family metallopeptidase [Alphaproteobacteria bacterium]|nr:M23 family metallopeptidase [Alphaproteobacteria bacterium]